MKTELKTQLYFSVQFNVKVRFYFNI